MPRAKKAPPNRSDNRWEVKISVGKGMNGKPQRKSFYSDVSIDDARRQANEYTTMQKARKLAGLPEINDKVKFIDLAKTFLEIKKSQIKEYSYVTTYETPMNKYIVPEFGEAITGAIKPVHLTSFFAKYSTLSQSRLNKMKLCFDGVFEIALDNDIITKNPMKHVIVIGKQPKTKQTYTAEQRQLYIDYCGTNGIMDMLLLATCAIRRSELLGLKWEDIDIDNGVLAINKSVTPLKTGYELSDTLKSKKSSRIIPIDVEALKYLKEHIGTGYVIPGSTRGYMSPSGYAHRFKVVSTSICQKLGIPYIPPHNLRHTVATLMYGAGTDIYTVSKFLGHSDIGITSKTYVHDNVEMIRSNIKLPQINKADSNKQ